MQDRHIGDVRVTRIEEQMGPGFPAKDFFPEFDADGAASMRNLIAEGYRPYVPTPTTTLSGIGRLGRVGFVHWEKSL